MDRINEEHANSPPQTINEVCDLVQDLRAHPPTSPVKDPVIQVDCELPATTTLPTPTLFMETVTETVRPPLLLARRATATPAQGVPHPPTIATKCLRKEYRANEEVRQKPKRPKALSALGEIQKLQEEVEPILPWLPFVRLIHELLFTKGPYRIQRQAIQALRAAAEAYIVEVLGGGNLACMHRDRCTLIPKDICSTDYEEMWTQWERPQRVRKQGGPTGGETRRIACPQERPWYWIPPGATS